jgi:DNA-binding MarR family transcriptional regulator
MAQPDDESDEAPDRTAGKGRRSRASVDYASLAQFRYHLRIFLAFSEANAKRASLTSQQYQVLLTIKGFSGAGPMSVGELARLMLIKHHSAVELVERMNRLGLVAKSIDTGDKRRVMVSLTKLGPMRLKSVAAKNFEYLGSSSPSFLKVLKSIRRPK